MTSTDTTYNGWTNYETWNVALWMDNDEGSYEMVREMAREAHSKCELRDSLKLMYQAEWEDILGVHNQASMFADLMGHALDSVNWYEIATGLLEEIAGEDDEDV